MSAAARPDPAAPPRLVIPSAAALAHEARSALTVAYGRLQRLHRLIDQGAVDCAAFLVELDEASLAIRRTAALVDALESAAGGGPPAAVPPSAQCPDD